MKNLFSINKTDKKDSTGFDPTPYTAAHVSDEVRDRLAHAFDDCVEEPARREPTPEERELRRRSRLFWIGGMVALVIAVAIFILNGQSEEPNTTLTVVQFALLLGSIVLSFLGKRITQKLAVEQQNATSADMSAVTARLEEASAAAARELGVPKGAANLDILPLHYKLTDKGTVRVGRKNHFDNITVAAWVEDGALCLATAQELFRLPLTALRGYRVADEDFEIDYWLKSDPPDSDTYAAYNIRPAGLFAKKCRKWYAIDVDGEYEVLVPSYDWDILTTLVPLNELQP